MQRSYYSNSIAKFLEDDVHSILGHLSQNHRHDLEEPQKRAWLWQIKFLKRALLGINGSIYFEFSIPRMGKRVDVILIVESIVFVIEFKVGENQYSKSAQYQTIDYCLDLKNFHEGSHDKLLLPVLIATDAEHVVSNIDEAIQLKACILCNATNFKDKLYAILYKGNNKEPFVVHEWEQAIYKPTPTIIEAAQALYKGHNVQEISRSDSGAINLSRTTQAINSIIEHAKSNSCKSICFLTGVPGAGKTLAGLNIANERLKADESEHSVFLSGNGPLVDVLREALARDAVDTAKEYGKKIRKNDAERQAKAFVQNIHHFRDENLRSDRPPIEKVVVFDEAQRAWQKEQVGKFMKTKRGIDGFEMSEPEYLIGVMNRHEEWCTIVCLIGGGQEINTGEAGVSEWIQSLMIHFPDWKIYYSDKIISERKTYISDSKLITWLRENGTEVNDLHLGVSVRSFRSNKLAFFVELLLENEPERAKEVFETMHGIYPIVVTRDIHTAKNWLRQQARGNERVGIVASSGGRRLRADGIDVKNEIEPAYWFLNPKGDIRSSHYLEEVATEFDIQGLEIDFACVAWDINLYHFQSEWRCQNFKGTSWQNMNQESAKTYLINSYRVLLTRARQGMVLYVPNVDGSDETRPKELYDSTFSYIMNCGIPEIQSQK